MAYRELVCTDMNQVPGLVAGFAVECGWAAAQDGTSRILRRPGAGPTPIKLEVVKATHSGLNYEAVAISRQGLAAFSTALSEAVRRQFALVRSPWLSSGAAQPVIPKPTKLHCFGAGAAEPFLAFVIEYGFNQYRPFYVGTLDAGVAGEVFACASGVAASSPVYFPGDNNAWSGMFSGRVHDSGNNGALTFSHGGVVIPDKTDGVAAGFADFALPTSSAGADLTVASPYRGVFGGPRDGVDDALISHGFSPFSGDVILVPVNLFTPVGAGTQTRARPLGSVRGVRGVNMRHLEPGQSFVVGNKRWRAFPQLRKSPDRRTPIGATFGSGSGSIAFPLEDSSWLWGFAYLEGDAA